MGERIGIRGERHHRAKLTDAQVREIRSVPKPAPRFWVKLLARRFGVSHFTLYEIRHGRARPDVKEVGP